jgi:hypothetical protein
MRDPKDCKDCALEPGLPGSVVNMHFLDDEHSISLLRVMVLYVVRIKDNSEVNVMSTLQRILKCRWCCLLAAWLLKDRDRLLWVRALQPVCSLSDKRAR